MWNNRIESVENRKRTKTIHCGLTITKERRSGVVLGSIMEAEHNHRQFVSHATTIGLEETAAVPL